MKNASEEIMLPEIIQKSSKVIGVFEELIPDSPKTEREKISFGKKIKKSSSFKSMKSNSRSDLKDFDISCDDLKFSEGSMKDVTNIDMGLIQYHKGIEKEKKQSGLS